MTLCDRLRFRCFRGRLRRQAGACSCRAVSDADYFLLISLHENLSSCLAFVCFGPALEQGCHLLLRVLKELLAFLHGRLISRVLHLAYTGAS